MNASGGWPRIISVSSRVALAEPRDHIPRPQLDEHVPLPLQQLRSSAERTEETTHFFLTEGDGALEGVYIFRPQRHIVEWGQLICSNLDPKRGGRSKSTYPAPSISAELVEQVRSLV